MNQDKFWNQAWTSDKRSRETEMISLLMHKEAVQFSYDLLGDISGKRLLEIGCGSGHQTLYFCRSGAQVTAIDVADESINATKNFLDKNSNRPVSVRKMNAEDLPLKDRSFDVVYINCMLMHACKERVLRESLRVLKPGGSLIIKETLQNWIFAFPYRFLSPYRKTNPHYITLSDVQKLKAQHQEFYLFSTSLLFLFYVMENKMQAYRIFEWFGKFDRYLLDRFPLLRKISWVTVASIKK